MAYPFFVEYIDECGNRQSEHWSEQTLLEEIRRSDVTITHIEPSLPYED